VGRTLLSAAVAVVLGKHHHEKGHPTLSRFAKEPALSAVEGVGFHDPRAPVILSEVVIRNADDNAVEEPALSGAEGTPIAPTSRQPPQGILPRTPPPV
jgi:hypothetical protein